MVRRYRIDQDGIRQLQDKLEVLPKHNKPKKEMESFLRAIQ